MECRSGVILAKGIGGSQLSLAFGVGGTFPIPIRANAAFLGWHGSVGGGWSGVRLQDNASHGH